VQTVFVNNGVIFLSTKPDKRDECDSLAAVEGEINQGSNKGKAIWCHKSSLSLWTENRTSRGRSNTLSHLTWQMTPGNCLSFSFTSNKAQRRYRSVMQWSAFYDSELWTKWKKIAMLIGKYNTLLNDVSKLQIEIIGECFIQIQCFSLCHLMLLSSIQILIYKKC